MNANYLYILIGVVVFMLLYALLMKQLRNKFAPKFTANTAELSSEQKRLLAFGAILFYHRGEDILGINPNQNLHSYQAGLAQQWEITNSQQAQQTLSALLRLERSSQYDEEILPNATPDLLQIQQEIAKELHLELSDIQRVKSAYAWDICRCVALAKWCYWCGYLTETEFWQTLQKASDIATHKGQNWREYIVSFLLGRTIQGFDLSAISVESQQLLYGKNPLLRTIEDIDVYQKYPFK